jgi:hypothetical protein
MMPLPAFVAGEIHRLSAFLMRKFPFSEGAFYRFPTTALPRYPYDVLNFSTAIPQLILTDW